MELLIPLICIDQESAPDTFSNMTLSCVWFYYNVNNSPFLYFDDCERVSPMTIIRNLLSVFGHSLKAFLILFLLLYSLSHTRSEQVIDSEAHSKAPSLGKAKYVYQGSSQYP